MATDLEHVPKFRRAPNLKFVELVQTGGQPSYWLNEEGIAELERMARDGLDRVTAAKRLGMSLDGIRAIFKRQPEAAEAWAAGVAELGDEMGNRLIEASRAGNLSATIFFSKAWLGKREVGPTDPNAQGNASQVQIVFAPKMSDDDFAKLIEGTTIEVKQGRTER
ncbi:MAG: hypothetical protein KDJ47_17070 [Hyphomicrobiaceae bacterium]|nr:hypothetical protein [Hyphomicrobiaceae bacterium]